MRFWSFHIAAALWLLAFGLHATAGDSRNLSTENPKELEKELESRYKGKVVSLRNFHKGEFLRYAKNGSLIHVIDTGTWTLYGLLEITDIAVKTRERIVQFRGKRRAVLFDSKDRRLEQYRTPLPLRLEIEYGAEGLTLQEIDVALTRMFLTPRETLTNLVPVYWKSYLTKPAAAVEPVAPEFTGNSHRSDGANNDGVEPVRVREELLPPKVLSEIKPEYTEEARAARHQGTVILGVVVRKDGSVTDIEIEQPLGLGLDEEAMEAIRLWRFRPGTRNGQPVDIKARMEVTFKLLH